MVCLVWRLQRRKLLVPVLDRSCICAVVEVLHGAVKTDITQREEHAGDEG